MVVAVLMACEKEIVPLGADDNAWFNVTMVFPPDTLTPVTVELVGMFVPLAVMPIIIIDDVLERVMVELVVVEATVAVFVFPPTAVAVVPLSKAASDVV